MQELLQNIATFIVLFSTSIFILLIIGCAYLNRDEKKLDVKISKSNEARIKRWENVKFLVPSKVDAVYLNGLMQSKSYDYTIENDILKFNEMVFNGDVIVLKSMSKNGEGYEFSEALIDSKLPENKETEYYEMR